MRMRKKKHAEERISACESMIINGRDDVVALKEKYTFPIRLEIGAGKGDFATECSSRHKDTAFIAMERISDVAVCLLEKAKEKECDNLRVIIGDAKNLPLYFEKGEISEIYLNFSDPWPKSGYKKRRLTYRGFLEIYKSLLCEGGAVFLKTDNIELFEFSLEELAFCGFRLENICRDLHASPLNEGNIETEYERNFSAKGFKINRVEAYFDKVQSESDNR